MKIHLARQGDELEVYIDELCIVVRDRYRFPHLFTKNILVTLIDLNTLLSASKNLGDGETTIYKEPLQMGIENNIDRDISEAIDEIPKEDRRRLLNESMNKAWPS